MTTLNPVKIPRDVWLNLNNETGISVGVAMLIQNVVGGAAFVCEKSTMPNINIDGKWKIPPDEEKVNGVGGPIVWAYSYHGCTLQVGEV